MANKETENGQEMRRTISYDKTVQTKAYHPISFFSSVKDIPAEKWGDSAWLENLWHLLVVQAHKMIVMDYVLRQELQDVEDPLEYLRELEGKLIEEMGTVVPINVFVNVDDEHALDERVTLEGVVNETKTDKEMLS